MANEQSAQPMICWIASYPRSGNTFFRIALSNILVGPGQIGALDSDFPEFLARRDFSLDGAKMFDGARGPVVFAKTHHGSPPPVSGVSATYGIYIYRHPLDVFLSCLNYIFLNLKTASFREYFLNDVPKSVEQIAIDGEMPAYLERWREDDGISALRVVAGRWSHSLQAWHRAAADSGGRIRCIDYAELIETAEEVVADLLGQLGMEIPAPQIAKGLERARAGTRPDGKFFWKGRPGTYRDFLSAEQIESYFDRYESTWSSLGISFAR